MTLRGGISIFGGLGAKAEPSYAPEDASTSRLDSRAGYDESRSPSSPDRTRTMSRMCDARRNGVVDPGVWQVSTPS